MQGPKPSVQALRATQADDGLKLTQAATRKGLQHQEVHKRNDGDQIGKVAYMLIRLLGMHVVRQARETPVRTRCIATWNSTLRTQCP